MTPAASAGVIRNVKLGRDPIGVLYARGAREPSSRQASIDLIFLSFRAESAERNIPELFPARLLRFQ